ncbi:hypothetical protein AQUCO_00600425v1 [Aquilegia coerulea]|uniref:DUF7912 domain-containing protein n=1 Tax=Aquilegia coerulea TaxID=218851 RepID=A0A2G5EPL7_AQUCA|nr:hypothetical protein AQUCO_00600425v1 [Aquilegia coerulea]
MMRNSFLQLFRSRRRRSCCWLTKRTYYLTTPHLQNPSSSLGFFTQFPAKPITPFPSLIPPRLYSTRVSNESEDSELEEENGKYSLQDECSDGWEEEEEREPEIGDGGDGGGIVFGDILWGQQALSIANEVLLQFNDDLKIFSFKNTPRGYIYVRLDKLSEKFGCPTMEEIEQYSSLYNKRLEEVGESGEIPGNLALEVSSPGAERLLKVPDDLERFKEMPMRVRYVEDNLKPSALQKDGVFLLESVEIESDQCVWKLADAKENRDVLGKGRPMSRKQKDWRITLPFGSLKRVMLYLDY